ncbi:Aste57867_9625 [Aphanomyces stellatus]|uniref:Aste57867_9625 protein n=1 Tax=Aphanomyces stellatus TaxID=120398 RepID=A0A485KNC5_9STRA|nr:hypothetical protein As57867_009587 [Aphanomyces stellatus]VFT86504.1 Aste57867_9625 [Aphanomyces stellatus]
MSRSSYVDERCDSGGEESADAPPVDDSVPLAFLLGHRYNYYMEAHRPVRTATEGRPRTPTDFRDMSKRQREVRAKMVLDPISHKTETFLTGGDFESPGQDFQSSSTRRKLKNERLQQQRKNASLKADQEALPSLDTSHGFARRKDFLAVDAAPVPTIHTDKTRVVHEEAQKARLKQKWRLQYAQRVHSIAKEQQEFAKHMLVAMGNPSSSVGNHSVVDRSKLFLEEKRVEIDRMKKVQEDELACLKQQKERDLNDLKDDIVLRNKDSKFKKATAKAILQQRVQKGTTPHQHAKSTSSLYKLDQGYDLSEEENQIETADVPVTRAMTDMFRSKRQGKMQKYVLKSPERPKPVFGGGFHVDQQQAVEPDDGSSDDVSILAQDLPIQLQIISSTTLPAP